MPAMADLPPTEAGAGKGNAPACTHDVQSRLSPPLPRVKFRRACCSQPLDNGACWRLETMTAFRRYLAGLQPGVFKLNGLDASDFRTPSYALLTREWHGAEIFGLSLDSIRLALISGQLAQSGAALDYRFWQVLCNPPNVGQVELFPTPLQLCC